MNYLFWHAKVFLCSLVKEMHLLQKQKGRLNSHAQNLISWNVNAERLRIWYHLLLLREDPVSPTHIKRINQTKFKIPRLNYQCCVLLRK